MRAWVVEKPGPVETGPLRRADREVPEPGRGELLVRVLACGVCRTDLHVAEGDLPVHLPGVTPGHEIVGEVVAAGPDCRRAPGDRVGVAWLRGTCGTCRYCRRGTENLCPWSVYTGWDAHGGYAEFTLAVDAFAYSLPDEIDDVRAAPLLCAGIVGYRALRRAELPPGGALGLWGFGGSAHLAAQIAVAEGAAVHVFTRSAEARELALSLGAVWAGGPDGIPPGALDSAIIFAPAGPLVPLALERLDRGGTLAIAGIHLTDVPPLNYERHLFQERQVRSVTANTRADGEEFLRLAARLSVAVTTRSYGLDEADLALGDLAAGRFTGAAVLVP
ncbi:zinc-dependent alcohol dehydrogenase family protein [Actinomadura xylanilytica]|uniref:zinc-dependent alcohol dehydrogenase family protein n=1 Tax=Actinomadura xylanilytica TaxID=887459 RepID=UPI00255ACA05|nr:zinc-dependent alcohol dehydrogenase family protein [Actinomadura xylanilytica]MDL4772680.1 zinc-dependent alcohol dehydrogenase family protein [Actinomadura xylanilytica]